MSVMKILVVCLAATNGANAYAENMISQSIYRMDNEVVSIGSDVWEVKKAIARMVTMPFSIIYLNSR